MNKVREQMGISVLYNLPDNWQEETFSNKSDNVGQFSTNLYFRTGVSQKQGLLLERTEINTSPAITIKCPSRVFTKRDREKNVVITLKS